MNTIDLLLTLSNKLADVLAILMAGKGGRAEREQAQLLLQQHQQLQGAHTHIFNLLQTYDQALSRSLTRGNVQELFPLCTYEGYQRVERLHQQYRKYTINHLVQLSFDLLAVHLTEEQIRRVGQGTPLLQQQVWAHAYTRERWQFFYQNSQPQEQELVNCYELLLQDGTWKVATVHAFVRPSS